MRPFCSPLLLTINVTLLVLWPENLSSFCQLEFVARTSSLLCKIEMFSNYTALCNGHDVTTPKVRVYCSSLASLSKELYSLCVNPI